MVIFCQIGDLLNNYIITNGYRFSLHFPPGIHPPQPFPLNLWASLTIIVYSLGMLQAMTMPPMSPMTRHLMIRRHPAKRCCNSSSKSISCLLFSGIGCTIISCCFPYLLFVYAPFGKIGHRVRLDSDRCHRGNQTHDCRKTYILAFAFQ